MAAFLVLRKELLDFWDSRSRAKPASEDIVQIMTIHEKIVAELVAQPESKKNHGVILYFLQILSGLYVEAKDYPKNLTGSNDLLPEDVPFPSESQCKNFFDSLMAVSDYASCKEYLKGRMAFFQSQVSYLKKILEDKEKAEVKDTDSKEVKQQIVEIRAESNLAIENLKYWSEEKGKLEKKLEKLDAEEELKVIVECRKLMNSYIKERQWSTEEKEKFKENVKKMESQRIEQAKAGIRIPRFSFQHCVTVDELVVDAAHLLAEQLCYANGKSLPGLRVGKNVTCAQSFVAQEEVCKMTPFMFVTLDEKTCNRCGTMCVQDKEVICPGECKGKYDGVYCSDACREADKLVHSIFCAEPTEGRTDARKDARNMLRHPEKGVNIDPLVFQLYYKTVAWVKSQNKCPADFAVLHRIIQIGLSIDAKEMDIRYPPNLAALDSTYKTAMRLCKISRADPRHDFYLHAGLLMGIRKVMLITYGDVTSRAVSPDPASTAGLVMDSGCVGAGIYPAVVFAELSCSPNVELWTGKDGESGQSRVQLKCLQPLTQGRPVSFCFADFNQMDHRMREEMYKRRCLYCECKLCNAQRTLNAQEQRDWIKKALITAAARKASQTNSAGSAGNAR